MYLVIFFYFKEIYLFMIASGKSHTAYDVMREYMITNAELVGKYDMPLMERYLDHPGIDTIDFTGSYDRHIKNHNKLTVNFYIHDNEFEKVWSRPDKYIEHLKCFHSVIAPDFSMSVGTGGMPFAMNLWNKYRNHALAHYLALNGVKVIPNVAIPPEYCYDWIFDGMPQHSVVACCTNGRIKAKASRIEFCNGFNEMVKRLQPIRVIIVGLIPEELETDIEIINFKTRNQQIKGKEGIYGF